MADIPIKQRLLFDTVDPEKVPYNISDQKAYVFGGVLIGLATLDLLATGFLLVIAFVTTAMDGMKLSEKILVYNFLVPDLILELLVLYFIGPATLRNQWNQGLKDTSWMAFLHTACIFHPHLATATICYVVALSMTDAYMFEMANDMKHMSVVVLSNVAVTICFCSLPATEDEGYGFQRNWLSPSFNIRFQYGSTFMCVGMLAVVAFVEVSSILKLIEARKFYQENISRVTKKQFEELEQEIVFCIISLALACMVLPVVIGLPDPLLMFLPRVIIYLYPMVRVVVLLNNCPHFQFAFFVETDVVDDFAALEGLGSDVMADKQAAVVPPPLPPPPIQPEPTVQTTPSGAFIDTEL